MRMKGWRVLLSLLPFHRQQGAIYTLLLEGGHYYVGCTTTTTSKDGVKERFQEHLSGGPRAAAWTKKHAPICVVDSRRVFSSNVHLEEDKQVKEMMMKHGMDKVRGGSYAQVSLTFSQIQTLTVELQHAQRQCFQCGMRGHVVSDCPSKIILKFEEKNNEATKQSTSVLRKGRKGQMVTTQELSCEQTNEQQYDGEITTTCEEMECCERCGRMDHQRSHYECNATNTIYANYDFFSWNFLSKKRKPMKFDCCKRCGRFRPPFGDCSGLCLYPTNVFWEEEFYQNTFLRGARTQQMEADLSKAGAVISTKEDDPHDPEEEGVLVCARCKRYGHLDHECYRYNHCIKCGREGHIYDTCFYRKGLDFEVCSEEQLKLGIPVCSRCGYEGHSEQTCHVTTEDYDLITSFTTEDVKESVEKLDSDDGAGQPIPATQDPARMMKGLKAEDVEGLCHEGSKEFSVEADNNDDSSRNEREWMAIQIDSQRAGLLRSGEGVQDFLDVPVHRYGPKHSGDVSKCTRCGEQKHSEEECYALFRQRIEGKHNSKY